MPDEHFDVAILGAGIAGTVLGAILARQGLSVVILEDAEHPRFTIGESTIPEFTLRMRLAAIRFDVPELAYLTNFHEACDKLGTSHGVKRAFSFLYHRAGMPQIPQESVQVATFHPPIGPDMHLYRQDVDAYYLGVAVRYGARVLQKVKVVDLDAGRDIVRIRTQSHGEFRTRYVADAGGIRSPLATALGLRDEQPRFRTNSRAIYSHFIGVEPYDAIGNGRRDHKLPYPLSQSTLHHQFDGGWFWVIPFNNHRRSTNPLCSVGLLLDCDRFPRREDVSPETEFAEVVARFPSIARQLRNARPVRGFAATGRLQYSSRQIVGPRWSLTSHAGAFVDPLFSSGLMITVGTITLLAEALLAAFRDNDFSTDRFSDVEDFVQHSFSQFDRAVEASYTSFKDFSLWNAWGRVYLSGVLMGAMSSIRCYFRYVGTGDKSFLADIDRLPYRAVAGAGFPETQKIFNAGYAELMRVKAGERTIEEASQALFSLLKTVDFVPPSFDLANPERRAPMVLTLPEMGRDRRWVRKSAPPWLREQLFDWPPTAYVNYAIRGIAGSVTRSLRRSFDPLREAFSPWVPHW